MGFGPALPRSDLGVQRVSTIPPTQVPAGARQVRSRQKETGWDSGERENKAPLRRAAPQLELLAGRQMHGWRLLCLPTAQGKMETLIFFTNVDISIGILINNS